MKHWFEISPGDAVALSLPAEGIQGPVNELGEECPWPWDPQQRVNEPMGMYHCPYCGCMVMAGLPHTDYTGDEL